MISAGVALHVLYLRVPGGLSGTYKKVVQGYLGGFASVMTNATNFLDFEFAPDARVYNLETMEFIKNVETPEQAVAACESIL